MKIAYINSYIFLDVTQLDEMYEMVKRIEFPKKKCPKCEKVFKTKLIVQRHYLQVHIFPEENRL